MKKLIIIGLFIVLHICSYSQNLDLIVKISGDSIACKIDSVTDTQVFFKMISANKWRDTFAELDDISDIKRNYIDSDKVYFKAGTSSIQNRNDHLQLKIEKAQRQRKSGAILSIAGPALVISAFIVASQGSWSYNNSSQSTAMDIGEAMFYVGAITTLVGLPILIIGSSRVHKYKNALSDSYSIEIAPCSFHYYKAQLHQNGVSLTLRF